MTKIAFAGDIVLDGTNVEGFSENSGSASAAIRKITDTADIFTANLECPLTTWTQQNQAHYSKIVELGSGKRIYFKADPERAKILSDIGLTAVSIANNHILDYGEPGLVDTRRTLEHHQIKAAGAGTTIDEARQPIIVEHDGISVGIIAASYTYEATRSTAGAAPLWLRPITRAIKDLRKAADIVILHAHAGVEFSTAPTRELIRLYRHFVDSGAHIIVGHHPHVPQPIETYNGGIIAYSMGNLIYDTSTYGSELPEDLRNLTRQSAIVTAEFEGSTLRSFDVHQMLIGDGWPVQTEWPIAGSSADHRLATPQAHTTGLHMVGAAAKIAGASIRRGQVQNLSLLARRAWETVERRFWI